MFRTENEFVRWIRSLAGRPGGRARLGIGDDAALVEEAAGQELILTTDLTLEAVHFRRDLHPPRAVGHRALARSLSDVAAMGGTPRFALVSLALSRRTTRPWVEEFYGGFAALAKRFGVRLIGGDTAVVAGRTMIDVIVAGEVPRGQALRRAGARPGDQIFVSGQLGLSALGLRLLKSRSSGQLAGWPTAVRSHLYPEPLCALGRYLSVRRLASALIDLSDGLSTDLARLCQASGVGGRLWSDLIPRPPLDGSQENLDLALHGGEDYQLLFTVPPHQVSRVPSHFRRLPLSRIGEIERRSGVRLAGADGRLEPLIPAGWDCFRR
jgi:thiamine-monophosphate kinase